MTLMQVFARFVAKGSFAFGSAQTVPRSSCFVMSVSSFGEISTRLPNSGTLRIIKLRTQNVPIALTP